MTLRTCKHLPSIQPTLGMLAYWPANEVFTSINSDREYREGLN
jgi:hypothetical protein